MMKKIFNFALLCCLCFLTCIAFCACGERYDGAKLVFSKPGVSINLSSEQKLELSVTLSGGNGVEPQVELSSSDTSKMRIENQRLQGQTTYFDVVALRPGKAQVLAVLMENSEISANIEINISKDPETLDVADVALLSGDTINLSSLCKVMPEDATNKNVTFSLGSKQIKNPTIKYIKKTAIDRTVERFLLIDNEEVKVGGSEIEIIAKIEGTTLEKRFTIKLVDLDVSIKYFYGESQIMSNGEPLKLLLNHKTKNEIFALIEILTTENISEIKYTGDKSLIISEIILSDAYLPGADGADNKYKYKFKISAGDVLENTLTAKLGEILLAGDFKLDLNGHETQFLSQNIPERVQINSAALALTKENANIVANPYKNGAPNYLGAKLEFTTLPYTTSKEYLVGYIDTEFEVQLRDSVGNLIIGERIQSSDATFGFRYTISNTNGTYYIRSNNAGEQLVKFVCGDEENAVEGFAKIATIEGIDYIDEKTAIFSLDADGKTGTFELDISAEAAGKDVGKMIFSASSNKLSVRQSDINKNKIIISATGAAEETILCTLGNGVTFRIDCKCICQPNAESIDLLFANNSNILKTTKDEGMETIYNIISTPTSASSALRFLLSFSPSNAEIDYTIMPKVEEGFAAPQIIQGSGIYSSEIGKYQVEVVAQWNTVSTEGTLENQTKRWTIRYEVVELSSDISFNLGNDASANTITIYTLNSVGVKNKNYTESALTFDIQSTNSICAHLLGGDTPWINGKMGSGDVYITFDLINNANVFDFDIETGVVKASESASAKSGTGSIVFTLFEYGRTISKSVRVNVLDAIQTENLEFLNIDSNAIYSSREYNIAANTNSVKPALRLSALNNFSGQININFSPNDTTIKQFDYSILGKQNNFSVFMNDGGLVITYSQTTGLNNELILKIYPKDAITSDTYIKADKCKYIKIVAENGTEDAPYVIQSEDEFIAYMTSANQTNETYFYKLTNDINLTNHGEFLSTCDFAGNLDGDGHKIIGINLRQNASALFNSIRAGSEIKNISFYGNFNITIENTLDWRESIKLGLIAGENYGTIKNCLAHLSASTFTVNEIDKDGFQASEIRRTHYIGGLVGQNFGDIISCKLRKISALDSITININDKDDSNYNQNVFDNVVVGGICGENSGAIYATYDEDYSIQPFSALSTIYPFIPEAAMKNYKSSDLTVDFDIIIKSLAPVVSDTQIGTFAGLICGRNIFTLKNGFVQTISNLTVAGKIKGGAYVGGLIGDNHSKIYNCISTAIVSSTIDNACIGGFAGILQNNADASPEQTNQNLAEVSNCYLMAVSDNTSPLKVSGGTSNYYGAMVGYVKLGQYNSCYALDFVNQDTSTKSMVDKRDPKIKTDGGAGVSQTFEHGKLDYGITVTMSNFYFEACSNLHLNYSMSPAGSSFSRGVTEPNADDLLGNYRNVKVSIPNEDSFRISEAYYQDENGNIVISIRELNNLSFKQLIDTKFEPNIVIVNGGAISVSGGKFVCTTQGLAKIRLSNIYNSSLTKDIYVYAYFDVYDFDIFTETQSGKVNIDGKYITIYQNEKLSLIEMPYSIWEGVETDYQITNVAQITNLKAYFTLFSSEKFEYTDCTLSRVIIYEIDGTTFTRVLNGENDKTIAFKLRCIKGTTEINSLAEECAFNQNENHEIELNVVTDKNDDFCVVKIIDDKNKLVIDEFVQTRYDVETNKYYLNVKTPSYSKDIEYYTINIYDDRGGYLLETIKLVILPPKTAAMVATLYSEEGDLRNGKEGTHIYSGSNKPFGILLLDAIPSQRSDDVTYEISSESNHLKFEWLNSNLENIKNPSGSNIAGSRITANTDANGRIYLRVILQNENYLPDDMPIIINVRAGDTGKDYKFVYHVKNLNDVKFDIGGLQRDFVATGYAYKINYETFGYFIDTSIASQTTASGVSMVTLGDTSKDYLEIKAPANYVSLYSGENLGDVMMKVLANNGTSFELSVTAYKEGASALFAKTDKHEFTAKPYVITSLHIAGAIREDDYEYVEVGINETFSTKLDFILGLNIEYDPNNIASVDEVRAMKKTISSHLYIDDNKFDSEKDVEIKEQDHILSSLKPKRPIGAEELAANKYIELKLSPNEYHVLPNLSLKLKVFSFYRTEEDEYLDVNSITDFKLMQDGNNYRLTKDLDFNEAPELLPFSKNIMKFDGNGHSIILPREIEVETSSWSLFANRSDKFAVMNLKVVVDTIFATSLRATNISIINSQNVGMIYNCLVTGGKLEVDLRNLESLEQEVSVAVIAMTNDGYITNTRVENLNITASGTIAGFVNENNNKISNCYVKECNLKDIKGNYSNSIVSGFVIANNANGKIASSYVLGRHDISDTYCDSSLYQIDSQAYAVGYVYKNAGAISDCYSNMPIVSALAASAFVYINEATGEIINCYAACKVQSNITKKYPFISISYNDNYNNEGLINGCYYYDVGNVYSALPEMTGLNKIEENEEKDFSTFAFSTENVINAIWSKSANLPELIGPNKIVSTSYDKESTDDGSGKINWKPANNTPSVGSEFNPYIIYSARGLENIFLQSAKEATSSYIRLIKDIDYADLNGVSVLSQYSFLGELEGNNCSISNVALYSNATRMSAGFFSEIGMGGVVKNLQINALEIDFVNAQYVGGLAGRATGAGVLNCETNCAKTIMGSTRVGGVVGYASSSIFHNIKSSASINATSCNQGDGAFYAINTATEQINNLTNCSAAGGLVGQLATDAVIKIGSVINGKENSVYVVGQIVGGVVGIITGNANSTSGVENVIINTSALNLRGLYCSGGFVGAVNSSSANSAIKDCFFIQNACSFTGGPIEPVITGGVVGWLLNGTISYTENSQNAITININNNSAKYVGGVAGMVEKGNIENINITGNVSGYSFVGGIVGKIKAKGDINIQKCKVLGNVVATAPIGEAGGVCGEILNTDKTITLNENTISPAIISASYLAGGIVANISNVGNGAIINIYKNNIATNGKMTIQITSQNESTAAGKVFASCAGNNPTAEGGNNQFGDSITIKGNNRTECTLTRFKVTVAYVMDVFQNELISGFIATPKNGGELVESEGLHDTTHETSLDYDPDNYSITIQVNNAYKVSSAFLTFEDGTTLRQGGTENSEISFNDVNLTGSKGNITILLTLETKG